MVTASARSLPAGAIAFPAISRIARAQTYPARPVRIIVPYVAGASSDIIARLFAQALSERLGQQFAVFEGSLGGKWLGLLLEIAPGLKRAAIMFNPETAPASVYMPSIEIAARSLKVMTIIAPVHDEGDIETAIVSLGREPGGGLVVTADAFVIAHRAPIILAAARNNLPAVYIASDFVRDGGLLSYAPDLVDNFRRAATFVDRILRGAKPGDLPVQFPTKYEMSVNLKTAKALGLTVPQSILLTADEVIE